jgi:hypothetical protein
MGMPTSGQDRRHGRRGFGASVAFFRMTSRPRRLEADPLSRRAPRGHIPRWLIIALLVASSACIQPPAPQPRPSTSQPGTGGPPPPDPIFLHEEHGVTLGPAPSCPPVAPTVLPHAVGPFHGYTGSAKVWVSVLQQLPRGRIGLIIPPSYLGGSIPLTEYGYAVKTLWVMDRTDTSPVVLHGVLLGAGLPLWLMVNTGTPATSLKLDPTNPLTGSFGGSTSSPEQAGNYPQFPGAIFIPQAGCYSLEASWPNGGWHLVFSAGT